MGGGLVVFSHTYQKSILKALCVDSDTQVIRITAPQWRLPTSQQEIIDLNSSHGKLSFGFPMTYNMGASNFQSVNNF